MSGSDDLKQKTVIMAGIYEKYRGPEMCVSRAPAMFWL